MRWRGPRLRAKGLRRAQEGVGLHVPVWHLRVKSRASELVSEFLAMQIGQCFLPGLISLLEKLERVLPGLVLLGASSYGEQGLPERRLPYGQVRRPC